jgi:Kef-type K+ transport system membrane component KefB/nucleotide-binding universal stress UspA family protein
MFPAAVTPIPGNAVFVLLVQLALMLLVARLGAGASRAVGLPAVVGELAAGIILGPSVFGHYAPQTFAVLCSQTAEQFHLLETVGLLGLVLLLLLTGIETDLKLLRNLGRAAAVASAFGMLVPFVFGFVLGMLMPVEFLAQPQQRMLFAAFLATAMSISAMPVIAKILMDLDLTRRNIGLVILSAGVVDDTAGWLILSVIAGAATHGGDIRLGVLAVTFFWMCVFLAVVALVLYPVLRWVLPRLARNQSTDATMAAIVVVGFLCAAATERIGVHAVFGAFIAGTALRQVPHVDEESVHRLESFVFMILAPIFFVTVGLQVDLWTLASAGGGRMLALVLGTACLGKLLGCAIGGRWGGLSVWESISIAVAMNARGAMGLVVASIGLSLGILNPQMFSIIVVVAIVTSFLAPVLLRLTVPMVRVTREEEDRMLAERSRGAFDTNRLRLLIPTAGGPNALIAAKLGFVLASRSSDPLQIVYVDEKGSWLDGLFHFFRPTQAGRNIDQHLAAIRQMGGEKAIRVKRLTGRAVSEAVIDEASKGTDVILVGASGGSARIGGRILEDIVRKAPCHVAIVKAAADGAARELKSVFVPIDGTAVSRIAAEFGLLCAQGAGAELTLGLLSERRVTQLPAQPDAPPSPSQPSDPPPESLDGRGSGPPLRVSRLPADEAAEELERISPVFRIAPIKPRIERIDYDPGLGAVAETITRGGYDLVVLGAENRAVRRQLFFGHENQRIIDLDSVTTAILVPKFGR